MFWWGRFGLAAISHMGTCGNPLFFHLTRQPVKRLQYGPLWPSRDLAKWSSSNKERRAKEGLPVNRAASCELRAARRSETVDSIYSVYICIYIQFDSCVGKCWMRGQEETGMLQRQLQATCKETLPSASLPSLVYDGF